jgi:ribosomal protein L24
MRKIKRDDEIIVTAGKDKGKRGKVLKVQADGRLLISGVNIIKKHQKPNPQMNVPKCSKMVRKFVFLNPTAKPLTPNLTGN